MLWPHDDQLVFRDDPVMTDLVISYDPVMTNFSSVKTWWWPSVSSVTTQAWPICRRWWLNNDPIVIIKRINWQLRWLNGQQVVTWLFCSWLKWWLLHKLITKNYIFGKLPVLQDDIILNVVIVKNKSLLLANMPGFVELRQAHISGSHN